VEKRRRRRCCCCTGEEEQEEEEVVAEGRGARSLCEEALSCLGLLENLGTGRASYI
jgi:hypothetical protein